MYNQCKGEWWKGACDRFADLYYTAVHVFGSKRSNDEYELAEIAFRAELEKLKEQGVEIPEQ